MAENEYDYRIVIWRRHEIVKRSSNLRGILDYARKSEVVRVHIVKLTKETKDAYRKMYGEKFVYDAMMFVTFANRAHCAAKWQSFNVACHWVENRRSWGLRKVVDRFLPDGQIIVEYTTEDS